MKVMHFDFVVEDPNNGSPETLEELVIGLFEHYHCRVTRSSSCTTADVVRPSCEWRWIGEDDNRWHRCDRRSGHSGWHEEKGETHNVSSD